MALLARRKEKLDAVVAEIEATGRRALTVTCDVADEESVKAAMGAVLEHFGKIDILLNNAGVAQGGSVENLTTGQFIVVDGGFTLV